MAAAAASLVYANDRTPMSHYYHAGARVASVQK